MSGWIGGQSFLLVFFGIIVLGLIVAKIVVDDVNPDDQKVSPS